MTFVILSVLVKAFAVTAALFLFALWVHFQCPVPTIVRTQKEEVRKWNGNE